MKTAIHINFDGRCEEAFTFYEGRLGAKIGAMFRYGETPASDQVPPEWHTKIVNGEIYLNDVRIAGGDLPPDQYSAPTGFAILLSIDSESETKRIFEGMSKEGKIQLPIQKTFWSSCYGIVTDKFGITWKLSCTA